MKRIRTALCLILAAALLAGCAFLPSDSEPETPAPTDPLTGLALKWQGQRPVAVAIENSTASTTQWGLSSASVVLEALTEVGTAAETSIFLMELPLIPSRYCALICWEIIFTAVELATLPPAAPPIPSHTTAQATPPGNSPAA